MSGVRPYDPFGAAEGDPTASDEAAPSDGAAASDEAAPSAAWSSGNTGVPESVEEVDGVAREVGRAAVRRLLDALATSPSRSVRRRAFDRLVERGSEAGPEAARRLRRGGQPWYVVRNLLALIVALPEWPRGWSPSTYASHPHPAVRLEALRLLVRLPRRRDWAMCKLLTEGDPKALSVGLAAAQVDSPPDALPILRNLAEDATLSPDLRRLAIRALGVTGAPEAKETLLAIATASPRWYDRLLRRTRLSEKSYLLLEAIAALRAWKEDPEVRGVLRRAAVDLDRKVRQAAAGVA